MLKRLLKPDLVIKDICSLELEYLTLHHIKTLILDVDNTLMAKDYQKLNEGVLDYLKEIQRLKIEIVLVSNNAGKSRLDLAHNLDVKILTFGLKPFKFRFNAFKKELKLSGPMVMVGDQLFTDILFAKRIKAISVLVNPLSTNEYISTKILRVIERKLVDRV